MNEFTTIFLNDIIKNDIDSNTYYSIHMALTNIYKISSSSIYKMNSNGDIIPLYQSDDFFVRENIINIKTYGTYVKKLLDNNYIYMYPLKRNNIIGGVLCISCTNNVVLEQSTLNIISLILHVDTNNIYGNLLNKLTSPVVIWKKTSNIFNMKLLKCVFINDAVRNLSTRKITVIGKYLKDAFSELSSVNNLSRVFKNVFDTGETEIVEMKYSDKNFDENSYRFMVYKLSDNCIFTITESIGNDVKNMKKFYEIKSNLLSDRLANMSHEIRTPLNGVIGMLTVLEDTQLNIEQKEYIEVIKDSSYDLMTIINDILDISKMEMNKLSIDNEKFDIIDCIEDCKSIMKIKADQKNIPLICNMDDDIPRKMIGDKNRLKQVCINLLSNAIKFTQKGRIVLTVSYKDLGKKNKMIISVKDTGIGIPENKIDKIFEPFYQVDDASTKKFKGTGLGLSICRKLANLMGGYINVESKSGYGSTFTVTIITEKCVDLTLEFMVKRIEELKNKNVLVVDDDSIGRFTTCKYLSKMGLIPIPFSNARDALMVLENSRNMFRMGMIDICMPEIDGYELSNRIKNTLKIDIPLIAISSIKSDPNNEHRKNFDDFILKPIRKNKLLIKITNILCDNKQLEKIITPKRSKILVVEDNITNCKVLKSYLAKLKYINVDIVYNGLQSVTRVKEHNYDIILMDIKMPIMNGEEATRKISEMYDENRPYIIALTAHALNGDREKYITQGFDNYISKPIDFNIFKNAMKNATDYCDCN
jgi:signal transduction histidine kinase/CheY-like chemotaxis protein